MAQRKYGDVVIDKVSVVSAFVLGISLSLFMGAFFLPLFHLGGREKNEVFLIISLFCAVCSLAGIIRTVNFFLKPEKVLGTSILLACSIVVFALSYPLTVRIFKSKNY